MPIFEYDCPDCGHACEILVRNESEPDCPNCGSHDLQKKLSVPAAPATGSSSIPIGGGCGEGPPCGAPFCGRLRQ